ncbi:phage holin family protein [Pseudoroseicyclus sp. H15]
MMDRLALAAAAIARNAALAIAALVCMSVGLGCLTAAGWIAIAAVQGHLVAALIVGGVWMLLGVILLLILARPARPAPVVEPAPVAPPVPGSVAATLAMAFAQGLGAGMSARRRP